MSKEYYPSLNFYIPSNLDLTIIPEYKEKHKEKYLWFIHSILFKSLTTKNSFNGYVNLNKELLMKYIGSKFYVDVRNRLIQYGIIELNKSYCPGAFSKSYRLSEKYRGAEMKSIDITKQTYCRKIYNSTSEYLKDVFKDNLLLQKEFLALTYAKIDYKGAIEYIKNTYNPKSQQYKTRLIVIEQFNRMYKTDFSDNSYLIDFTFVESKGRVYTPFTMLARDLEQFIYFIGYENEEVVTLDMPNSQLCFYSELIERRKKGVHIGNRNIEDNIRYIKDIENAHTNVSPINHTNTPYVYSFSNNWEDYIFNGLGYERMMYLSKWKGKDSGHTKEERQQFKEEFFGQLFYNKYNDRLTDLEMVFMQHHEETAKSLRELKYDIGNKLLAIEVQRLESQFFHKIVVNHIVRNYPNVPFIIKHDSISLPSSEASYLVEELNDLVREFFRCNNLKLKIS